MSLTSLSLATFFTAIQVGYGNRQSSSRNVRFVALVMLAVLTSGHFFPLLLSFNALWTKIIPFPDIGTPVKLSDRAFNGWKEAHEVIMRGTSMACLLLELRLLQLVWRSRTRADTSTPSKVSDVPLLGTCLPIYGTMIVVVASVHWQLGPHQQQAQYLNQEAIFAFVWADLQAFSGVVLDLFLLPQVIANVLWDTEEKVAPLYPLFYLGMTAVRSAEHLFDASRALIFVPEFQFSNYYFANPAWDLYSTRWDIAIPCLSAFLALVLLLQQRYGGRCFILKHLRRRKYQLIKFQPVDL